MRLAAVLGDTMTGTAEGFSGGSCAGQRFHPDQAQLIGCDPPDNAWWDAGRNLMTAAIVIGGVLMLWRNTMRSMDGGEG